MEESVKRNDTLFDEKFLKAGINNRALSIPERIELKNFKSRVVSSRFKSYYLKSCDKNCFLKKEKLYSKFHYFSFGHKKYFYM